MTFSAAFATEIVLTNWQKVILCPIYKVKITLCQNYRGITLLSDAAKIFSRVIKRRIRLCVEKPLVRQHEFRGGENITNQSD